VIVVPALLLPTRLAEAFVIPVGVMAVVVPVLPMGFRLLVRLPSTLLPLMLLPLIASRLTALWSTALWSTAIDVVAPVIAFIALLAFRPVVPLMPGVAESGLWGLGFVGDLGSAPLRGGLVLSRNGLIASGAGLDAQATLAWGRSSSLSRHDGFRNT